MADWPSITDDDQTGLTGTIFNKAFFDLIKVFIQVGSHSSGLDADKPETCSPGDIYYATDTEKLYVCFATNIWSEVGGAAVSEPEQVRLPDPEVTDFTSPSGKDSIDGPGAEDIINTVKDSSINMISTFRTRIAQKITLSGATINSVKIRGSRDANCTSGDLYCRVRKVSDDGIIETSSKVVAYADLPTSREDITFPLTCAPSVAVYISFEGSFVGGNGFFMDESSTDEISGSEWYYSDTTWTEITGHDVYITIDFAGVANTVDEDTDTEWHADPPDKPGVWISWDIGSLKYIGGCRIYWGAEAAYRPTEYKIYTSPDNSNWTEVIHEAEAAPASAWKTYQWYARYARYFKLEVTTHGLSGTKVYEVDGYSLSQEDTTQRHGHGGLS